ncbi:TonB-dependent receptor plug domain-containing protein, partial [Candidatus Eisenbacteria bacterium]
MNNQITNLTGRSYHPAGNLLEAAGHRLMNLLCFLLLAFSLVVVPASADEGAQSGNDERMDSGPLSYGSSEQEVPIDDASGDFGDATELLLFEEIEEVVSAARRPQPISFSTATVSVINSEQIHYSGYPSIPDLLYSVPGMDILASTRNKIALGMRGLHHHYADRTLLLIDGRDATNPIAGGFDLLRIPLSSVDIKRIEVIRGPGGAAWGANAFNGVINIITKKPQDDPGFRVYSSLSNHGDDQTGFAYAATRDDWSYRLSGGHEDRESSGNAISDSEFYSRDFSRHDYFKASLYGKSGAKTDLSFGLSGIFSTQGDFEMAGFPMDPRGKEKQDLVYSFARADYLFDSVTNAYLQLAGKYQSDDWHGVYNGRAYTYELDGQVDTRRIDQHDLSFGTSARWTYAQSKRKLPEDLLPSLHEDEYWLGVFAIDAWHPSDALVVEAQVRADYYSPLGTDWSGRLCTLYSLDSQQDHVVRLSGAKAFRAPMLAIRRLDSQRIKLPAPPYPPDTYGMRLIRPENMQNEQIYSLEAGYAARLSNGLDLRLNAYYSRYESLVGGDTELTPNGQLVWLDNMGGADAGGLETEFAYTSPLGVLTAWYALNDFMTDTHDQSVRAYLPARHKIGMSWRFHLRHNLTVDARNRWTGETRHDPADIITGGNAPSVNRVDLVTTLA